MSRVHVTIDEVVLRGFDPADRKALLEGLQTELSHMLSDPATRPTGVRSHHTPALKLGSMPAIPGAAGGRKLGTRIAGAIGKGLMP
jgi:hypothetical protein